MIAACYDLIRLFANEQDMKFSSAFVIACDRFGSVREHSELIFCDMLSMTDPALFDRLKEQLGESSIAKLEGDRFLMQQFLEWFSSGNFTKSISYAGCDYQANWINSDSSEGVLKLHVNNNLHSVSLLIVERNEKAINESLPNSISAQMDLTVPIGFDELYETFAKSECLRLLPLTRRPLVVSRYFAEEFDVALRSWKLIRMLSYAFFKTVGAM